MARFPARRAARSIVAAASAGAIASVALGACAARTVPGAGTPVTPDKPMAVVASFYPLAYAAEQVGGPLVRVTDLTPPGAEPHDLELTSRQVDKLQDARVAVVMGLGFQPGVEAVARDRHGPTVSVLDAVLRGATPSATRSSVAGGVDPHVWLDPVLMGSVVDAVRDSLTSADPADRAAFAAPRAAALHRRLDALDARYADGLRSCTRREIVTSHEAFGRLASRYHLTQEGIAGFLPDAEPDPRRLAKLADLVTHDGITTIFTEALVSPKLAQTLARETGAKVEVLSPLESLTEDRDHPGDYFTVMADNLAKLRVALGCR